MPVPDLIASDTASRPATSAIIGCGTLEGKRAAMVTFSPYPFDPRPRRAVEALINEGMKVDLICLGGKNALVEQTLKGLEVLSVPVNKKEPGGKVKDFYCGDRTLDRDCSGPGHGD